MLYGVRMKENQLEDYYAYLKQLTTKVDTFFEQQRPYVCCKEGCSYCCEKGQYPCSELEFSFLELGYLNLDEEIKSKIKDKVAILAKLKKNNQEEVLECECPFLINKKCSVYTYRPIICRTFGIPFFDDSGKLKVPFCNELGLNYSQVYDRTRNILSEELFKKTGFSQEPLAYNLSLKFLISKVGKEGMKLDFGQQRTIVDWMIDFVKQD